MGYLKCKMNDDKIINYMLWNEPKKPIGIVVLVHGMAEHIMRYSKFAGKLNESGYVVFGHDQRGHGKTAGKIENVGHLGENGWKLAVDDIQTMICLAKMKYPELPVYLFGHSMGSFIAREYAVKHPNTIDGLIISGTGGSAGISGKFLLGLSRILTNLKGASAPSNIVSNITNDSFGKKIKPKRTDFDWLSTDSIEVDKYVSDRYCGTVFSNGFYAEMFSAIERVNNHNYIGNMNRDTPIYLISGENDPVGEYGAGVKRVYEMFNKIGIKDVSIKLYENGRHEMLNESNKLDVMNDIITWIESKRSEYDKI